MQIFSFQTDSAQGSKWSLDLKTKRKHGGVPAHLARNVYKREAGWGRRPRYSSNPPPPNPTQASSIAMFPWFTRTSLVLIVLHYCFFFARWKIQSTQTEFARDVIEAVKFVMTQEDNTEFLDIHKVTIKDTIKFYSILFYPITLEGRRGTTDEFATIPFHLVLFSAALVELAMPIPVHSLILFSHLFFCLPLFIKLTTLKTIMFNLSLNRLLSQTIKLSED